MFGDSKLKGASALHTRYRGEIAKLEAFGQSENNYYKKFQSNPIEIQGKGLGYYKISQIILYRGFNQQAIKGITIYLCDGLRTEERYYGSGNGSGMEKIILDIGERTVGSVLMQ